MHKIKLKKIKLLSQLLLLINAPNDDVTLYHIIYWQFFMYVHILMFYFNNLDVLKVVQNPGCCPLLAENVYGIS